MFSMNVIRVLCMYHHTQTGISGLFYDLCNDGGGIFDSRQNYMLYIRNILFCFLYILLDLCIYVPQNSLNPITHTDEIHADVILRYSYLI